MGFHFFCGRVAWFRRDPHRCTVFFFPLLKLDGFAHFIRLGFLQRAEGRQRPRGHAGRAALCTSFCRSFGRTHRAAITRDHILWYLRSYRGEAPEA